MSALLDGMKKVEGYRVGNSTVTSAAMPGATLAGLPTPRSANVPSMVPAQIPEQAKAETPERLNSGPGMGAKVSVSLKDKTGQGVMDARLAHIVSGGIGG